MNDPGHNINAYPKWATEPVLIAAPDPAWAGRATREIADLTLLLAGTPATAFTPFLNSSSPNNIVRTAKPIRTQKLHS